MSLFLAIHVEGHRREDGVQGQVQHRKKNVHVLVLDPHVRAPERQAAEAARGDPNLLQDLRLGLVGERRLRGLLDIFRLLCCGGLLAIFFWIASSGALDPLAPALSRALLCSIDALLTRYSPSTANAQNHGRCDVRPVVELLVVNRFEIDRRTRRGS